MKCSTLVWCVGIAVVAASLPTPVSAIESAARAFPLIRPFSLDKEPLAVPPIENVRLYQPHDGSFETGFTFAADEEVAFVQWFAFPSDEGRLLAFEACFFSYAGTVPDFEYEFQYFSARAAGEGAEPGSLLEDRSSQTFDVQSFEATCNVINFVGQGGSADPGVEIRDIGTYLGVEWDAEEFPTVLLAIDTNGPTTTNGWGRINDFVGQWVPLRLTTTFEDYRNLGNRVVWEGVDLSLEQMFADDFESGDTSNWSDTQP